MPNITATKNNEGTESLILECLQSYVITCINTGGAYIYLYYFG